MARPTILKPSAQKILISTFCQNEEHFPGFDARRHSPETIVQKLIQRFNLQLAPDDLNWFAGAWQYFQSAASSYNQPLDPKATLECAESVWGGQMLPDTIPILANGAGDYLCARFNHDGTLSEIIEWRHEGYHWRHFG
jgi:hypothetical protein